MNAVRSRAAGFKTGALLARPNLQKYRHATLKIGLWPPSGASVPVERNSVRCGAAGKHSRALRGIADKLLGVVSNAIEAGQTIDRNNDQRALSKPQIPT